MATVTTASGVGEMASAVTRRAADRPRRNLKLWGALGLSLGIVGPTLAMAGNGQGTVASVGKAVPIVFVFGAIGVALIAHGFVRLTQRYNHAGSAYALVGMTVGPRAGFFSGFCIMATYTLFSICCLAAVGAFLNAFIAAVQGNPAHPFQVPWVISALGAVVLSGFLNTRNLRVVTRTLLAIEGVGICCMVVLAIVILAKGGAPHTGLTTSVFSLKGSSFTVVMGAVVAGFLSWAGFEGCAALGEETDKPRKNIPRALTGAIVLTGILFVLMMYVQTVGYGTSAAGLHTFETQGNSLSTLGATFIGTWFELVISFAALMSAFACHLSSAATSGRLMFAFSRDGLGPRAFARLDRRQGSPLWAVGFVLLLSFGVDFVSWATGHPVVGTGNAALDSYFYFATIGAMTLMIAYLFVEIGTILHLARERRERLLELIFPVLGAALMVSVFYFNVKGQVSAVAAVFVAFMVAAVGLGMTFFLPGLATKVGEGLSAELSEPAGKELVPEIENVPLGATSP